MKLLHSYVLVELIPYEGETITKSGIIIPKTTPQETEGGRIVSVVDENAKYQPKGTVVSFSNKTGTDMPDLKVGSVVRLNKAALSPNHHFQMETDTPSSEWEGLILIPNGLIEAIL